MLSNNTQQHVFSLEFVLCMNSGFLPTLKIMAKVKWLNLIVPLCD